MADLLGYTASCAVLATFLMRTMLPLRLVAILSNVLFVAYGYVEHIHPVLFLHLALLPINFWRLFAHWSDATTPRRSAVTNVALRTRSAPYALWFAVGFLVGVMSPLPILLLVDKSEAAKLVLPFTVRAAPMQPANADR